MMASSWLIMTAAVSFSYAGWRIVAHPIIHSTPLVYTPLYALYHTLYHPLYHAL